MKKIPFLLVLALPIVAWAQTTPIDQAVFTDGTPTTLSGLMKMNGNVGASAAVAGTDYQAPGNYITALTGDGTAAGPGSAAFTLKTVNTNVGTFAGIQVNGKGQVTAATALTTAVGYGINNGSVIDSWGTKAVPSGTPVGTSDTQTLTNKTIGAAQLTGQVALNNGGSGASTAAAAVVNLTPASVANTESGGTFTLNWAASPAQTLTLNANLTSVTFSGAYDSAVVSIYVTNTSGNFTATWGNSIKWPNGVQPTQTIGAHTDRWSIQDIGGTFYGSVTPNY